MGDHDANGDNVLQDDERGVVIYSTNEDLLPLGTNSADIDVGAITVEEIEALVQEARDVNNWKSLQAAIDANSTVNFGTWLENANVTPGMPATSSAGFTVAYSGSYQNGYTSSKGYSISDVDNTARATFILGDHDANGDNVLQDSEVGVVIYSTNEDLLPLGLSLIHI